jgi:glycosyltransferase involved in cell wall biosynthesis
VLLIVGSGPEEQRLRQLASAGGLAAKIRFVSASPHVHELLNAIDVFVLPSINEGMSNTLLEAMACALPVIATNVGGNPEVVGDAGGGFLVPPADGEAIAGRLAQLQRLPDLRAAMGSAARQRIVESFSLAAMTRAYRELYLGLAQRRGLLDKNKSLCAE